MSLKKPSCLDKIETGQKSDKAILCLHGLNQNPSSLRPLLEDTSLLGFSVYQLKLPGHYDAEVGCDLTKTAFINNYKDSYEYLKSLYGEELYFIGYSFGGLIGVNFLDEVTYRKVILIAPALKLKVYTFAIQGILPFFNKVKSIPFFKEETERKYRYYTQGVPREIYRSFFSIFKEFSEKKMKSLKSTEALVFCHSKDELVDFKKLWKWLNENTNWNKMELHNSKAPLKKFNHLCFDKETLGDAEYEKMLGKMRVFLLN